MLDLSILITTIILNSVLGYVVYVKNPHSATNRLFMFLTSSFSIWAIFNYLSVYPGRHQLVLIRLAICFATLLCLAVYLTFTTFPEQKLAIGGWALKLRLLITGITMLLTLTPLVFSGLSTNGGQATPHPAVGLLLFAFWTTYLLVSGTMGLVKKYHKTKGVMREQFRLVILGLTGTFSLLLTANFILVVLFKNSSFVKFGVASTLIFTGSLGYAIVRHKLFDIRLLVARSLAYLLSWLTLGAIFLTVTYAVGNILFHNNVTATVRWVYTVLAASLALIFPVIKRFFDRATNHIFYRDAYDAQTFLDQFNKILVSAFKTDILLKRSIHSLKNTFNPTFGLFYMHQTTIMGARNIGEGDHPRFNGAEIAVIDQAIKRQPAKVVETDLLGDADAGLYELLQKKDIAVLVNLSSVDFESGVGYLMLGPKESGNVYGKQDIRILEIIANELVIAIQNALHFEEIQDFNLTLQNKVEAATHELRQTNKKLRELDEAKDDFISMSSHQLRTPLTIVKGYLSMLLEGDAGKISAQQKDYLEQAWTNSKNMTGLISDLLNVSRLQSGKFAIDATHVNLAELTQQIVSDLKGLAQENNVTLIYKKPEVFPEVLLDEDKTSQVIVNFTDNAIHYTPPGGTVEVSVLADDDGVEFQVHDTGIGVSEEARKHLFTKFYRSGEAKAVRPDGTGIGLYVAKNVILAQNGRIIFDSVPGQGSTFGFRLPIHNQLPVAQLDMPSVPNAKAREHREAVSTV